MDYEAGETRSNQQSSPVSGDNREPTLSIETKRQDFFKRIISHPLQHEPPSPFLGSSSGSSITFSSHTSSSVDTASLIQAAAKSILENSNEASCVASDDEDRHNFLSNMDTGYVSTEDEDSDRSPALQSLQREKLPTVPDEQDRKRFVGCLASVLASCYTYDTESDDTSCSVQNRNGYTVPQHLQKGTREENVLGKNGGDARISTILAPNNKSIQNKAFDLEASCLRSRAEILQDSIRRTNSSQQLFLIDSQPDTYCTKRYRKRRFDVLSRLLMRSAELMLLDKNQGKCFLPMLDKILKSSRSIIPKHETPVVFEGNHDRAHYNTKLQSSSWVSIDENDPSFSFLETKMNEIEHLRPFLESMSPGSGVRCLTMFLIRHLLHSDEGYDARIRHAVKTLGVLLILHDMKQDPDSFLSITKDPLMRDLSSGVLSSSVLASDTSNLAMAIVRSPMDLRSKATRLFENLESAVAGRLIRLSTEHSVSEDRCASHSAHEIANNEVRNTLTRQPKCFTSENLLRGLKIGGAAVTAGALFAVTGEFSFNASS
jgi:hypothetical protein